MKASLVTIINKKLTKKWIEKTLKLINVLKIKIHENKKGWNGMKLMMDTSYIIAAAISPILLK